MDKSAFSSKSTIKYRAGEHIKEKQALSLASQKIMVDDKGDGFQVKFPDIFAYYQNHPLTGDVNMGNKAWCSWQHTPMDWWQCQLNFAVWYMTAGCGVSADDHLQANTPSLRVCIASMFTMRRGVCLWSWKWPFLETNLILGIRTPMTPRPTSGSVSSSEFQSQLRNTQRKGAHGCSGDHRRGWCGPRRNGPPTHRWVWCAGACARWQSGSGSRGPPGACPVSYRQTAERWGPQRAHRSASRCQGYLRESGATRPKRVEARRFRPTSGARPPGRWWCTGLPGGVLARSSSSEYVGVCCLSRWVSHSARQLPNVVGLSGCWNTMADSKLPALYYSPRGCWKGLTAIEKLASAAKVTEQWAKDWLKRQAIWQIYLPAPRRILLPKFAVVVPNEVHQADLLFLPHDCVWRKTFCYALLRSLM